MNKKIVEAITAVVVKSAEFGANVPSAWFSYQPELPASLKESK